MAGRPGPTLRRRKVAKELAAARAAAGMSLRELAKEIDLEAGTISKIENAKQAILVRNIKSIGRATGLSKAKVDSLVLLAAEDDNAEEWLLDFRDDMPEWFTPYPEMERDADEIWTYTSELVDGLLQTPGYAGALIRADFPDLTASELSRSVELRQARQEILNQDMPPLLHVVFNEAVLRRLVGSNEVMAGQLRHLSKVARRPTITLQVLPFAAGVHPGMKSSFTLLRFPEGFDDMDCVYLENENGAVWQERSSDIARYTGVFSRQRALALSPEATIGLIDSLT